MGPSAPQANRKTGERMVEDEVRWLGNKAAELRSQYDPTRPACPLHTFEDVEQFWDQVVRPRFKDFKTMIELPEGQSPPKRESMWYANWKITDRS
jgi:hypothetical protein